MSYFFVFYIWLKVHPMVAYNGVPVAAVRVLLVVSFLILYRL
jgi:hypothetical protein